LSCFKKAHPKLDLKDDKDAALRAAFGFSPFWDISNGETLCHDCHSEEHPNLIRRKRRRRTYAHATNDNTGAVRLAY
jgi:hypothetical protein